jgi:two-component system LytT family response regulator
LATRALREYLGDIDWVQVVGEARTGPEAVRLIHKLEPDLIFLDVRMPGLTGLQVLEALTHQPTIVFTTAFDEYAVAAFEFGAVDYLVKPFGRERLHATLDRVRMRLLGEMINGEERKTPRTGRYPARLFAQQRGAIIPVPTNEILRIDATAGGVNLVTHKGIYSAAATIGELQERLDPKEFVRVHRSHIVSVAHVTMIRRYDERRLIFQLDDGGKLVASRRGSRLFRELMG